MLGDEEVVDELAVVSDLVHLGVEARERVQRALRAVARDARDRLEGLPRGIPLLVQPTRRRDEGVDRLHPRQRGLHGELGRHVRAQPCGGEQLDALEEAGGVLLGAGDDEPPRTVAGDAVGLGQPVERQAQQVGRECRERDVHGVVEEDPVVDLVGQQQQRVLARDLDDSLEHLATVDGPGRVVRVDDDDRLRAGRDALADVVEVGLPAVVGVAAVVHRRSAGEARHRRPQGIVGRGDEHLVALVEQSLHRHRDEFGHAVAEVDVVGVELREARHLLVARDDGAPRGHDAATVAVAVRVRDRLDHVAHDLERGLESEHGGIAGVQFEDRVPVGLEPVGLDECLPADLVQDVLELAGLIEGAQRHRHRISAALRGQWTARGPPWRQLLRSCARRWARFSGAWAAGFAGASVR